MPENVGVIASTNPWSSRRMMRGIRQAPLWASTYSDSPCSAMLAART